jgi:hypothetical protein
MFLPTKKVSELLNKSLKKKYIEKSKQELQVERERRFKALVEEKQAKITVGNTKFDNKKALQVKNCEAHLEILEISWENVYNESKEFTKFVKTLPDKLSYYVPVEIGNIILEFYDDFDRCFDDNNYFDSHQLGYVDKCNLMVSFHVHFDYRKTNSFLCTDCIKSKKQKLLQDYQDYD